MLTSGVRCGLHLGDRHLSRNCYVSLLYPATIDERSSFAPHIGALHGPENKWSNSFIQLELTGYGFYVIEILRSVAYLLAHISLGCRV